MPYRDLRDDLCSIARPVSVLGDRWTLLVLRQAFRGIRRFGHFQSHPGHLPAGPGQAAGQAGQRRGILQRRPYESEQRTRTSTG